MKIISLLALKAAGTVALVSLAAAANAIQLGVPSYYSPGATGFTTIANTGAKTGIVMLNIGNGEINPNDGATYDSEPLGPWVTQSQQSHTANTKVFCYVHSSYGARSISLVEGDVDAYFNAGVTVDGIFIDEADTSWTNTGASYYQPLYNYIKAHHPGTQVVINPGAIPDGPNWMNYACDICMDYESSYSTYTGVFIPSWVTAFPANRFWQAVLSTPTTAAAVDACFATAAANNCGYLYVTDLSSTANTYGSLPNTTVWNEEVADATGPGGTFSNEQAWDDGTNFYYQATYAGTYAHFNVLLDTDMNAATGYTINGIGADDLIEDTGLYPAASNGTTWSWGNLAASVTETTPSAGTVRFSVPLTAMGTPANARIAFQGTDASWNATTDPTVVSYTHTTTPPPPATPTGLTATAGNGQSALSWTASSGAASYSVFRSTTSGSEGTTPIATGITSTKYTDSGLTNGVTYYYKVAAVNTGGSSAQSSEASDTPLPPAGIWNMSCVTSGSNKVYQFSYPSGTWTYYHVFIDKGPTSATGYTISGISGFGADYLIENTGLYPSTYTSGTGSSWSWGAQKATASISHPNSTTVTLTIPFSKIGSPAHQNVVFQVVGSTTVTSTMQSY